MREALGGKNDLTDKYTKSHFCNHKSRFFFSVPWISLLTGMLLV